MSITPSDMSTFDKKDMDNELQTFHINGQDKLFKCIPNKTTNFDVFVLANPEINMEKATAIWDYYRSLFLITKFKGEKLSSFREMLRAFVENKPYPGNNNDFFSPSENAQRYNDINSYIGLARWLELQFKVDTAIDEINKGWTHKELETRADRILGTVPFNNYISYFSNNIQDKLKDPTDYNTRKLHVRSVLEYTHKEIRWYICDSEFGPVKVWIHTKHNPFMQMFEQKIKKGITINVVTSKILLNIDSSVPYIKIENFFLDP